MSIKEIWCKKKILKDNILQNFSEKQIIHLHETFSSTILFPFNVNFMSMPYRRRLDKWGWINTNFHWQWNQCFPSPSQISSGFYRCFYLLSEVALRYCLQNEQHLWRDSSICITEVIWNLELRPLLSEQLFSLTLKDVWVIVRLKKFLCRKMLILTFPDPFLRMVAYVDSFKLLPNSEIIFVIA